MSDRKPLVSVVIPTYGRSETLVEAIRSVADQTYDNIELLIVDDASPIPVKEHVSQVSAESFTAVRHIRHEENRGANAARNTGINAAKGEYIAFLDDDDCWVKTKISRQIEAFESCSSEVGVVYTGLREKKGERTEERTSSWRGNVVPELLSGRNFGQFSSVMVRADVIDVAGRPDERFPIWQDREWFFRLAQHCHFEPVSEPLTVRTIGRDDQISENFEAKRDVAYPLFVEKHRRLAAEYGWRYERRFLASLRFSLGKTAVRCQRYREARKYFLLAFFTYPLFTSNYVYVLATLGGNRTYALARDLRDRVPWLRRWVSGRLSN